MVVNSNRYNMYYNSYDLKKFFFMKWPITENKFWYFILTDALKF